MAHALESVTYVSGNLCYLCIRAAPRYLWGKMYKEKSKRILEVAESRNCGIAEPGSDAAHSPTLSPRPAILSGHDSDGLGPGQRQPRKLHIYKDRRGSAAD